MEQPSQLKVNGINIRKSGGGTKKVLFIHGFLGTSEDAIFLKNLDDATVYSVDLPGHGNSDPLKNREEASLENFPSLIQEAVASFAPFDLIIGYSLGGRIARELLEQKLLQADKWLFISTFFGYDDEEIAQIRREADQQKAEEMRCNPAGFFNNWNQQPLFNPKSKRVVKPSAFDIPTTSWILEAFSPGFQSFEPEVFEGVKVALLCSKKDVKFAEHHQDVATFINPALILEVGNGWHRVFEDVPVDSVRFVKQFLDL